MLFGLKGLNDYHHFFRALKDLPYPIVHRFLVEIREHEMGCGERQAWMEQHEDQKSVLRMATGAEGLPDAWETYVRYRLLRRPISFCMLALYGEDPAFLDECVMVEGREILDRTPGAIFVGTHFGPQTALPFLVAALGRRVTALMDGTERELVWSLLGAYSPQTAKRIDLIGIPDRAVLMKCVAKLRQGRSVVAFMEFSASDLPSKIETSFLNSTLPAPEGPFLLAAVTGRPIVPARVLHADDLRLRLVFDEPVEVPRLRRHELAGVIQPMWERLEQRVKSDADQWLGWEVLARRLASPEPRRAVSR